MTALSRPILRYHGGKWRLAPWIIEQMPAHRTYVEPFGGAGSVLLRKPRAYAEVYNDLSGEVVNLFRVLRGDRAAELIDGIRMTPFARDEFDAAYSASDDPVERARRLLVRASMGFGSGLAVNYQSTGFRSDSKKSGSTPSRDFIRYPLVLAQAVERLRGVVIENRPARDIIAQHDYAGALFYVDPPYLHETRSGKKSSGYLHHRYAHELTEQDHLELLHQLIAVKGHVIVSGYPHPLYDSTLKGWRRLERQALADGAKKRTEVLWMNFEEEKLL